VSVDGEQPASISELVRRAAQQRPDHVALIDGPRRLTWAELDRQVTGAALALAVTGLADGDRVALQLGTSIDFALLYLGANRAGLVVVPVNPAYTLPELAHVLSDSGAGLLVTSNAAAVDADVPEVVFAAEDAPDGRRTVAELLGGSPGGDDPRRDRSGEQIAVLLYTSGTSGRPRGAMLSSRALLANLGQGAAVDPPLVTPDDVVYVPLPLFHVFGLNAGLGIALYVGATTVLADRFDPGDSLATIAAERASVVVGAPGMFVQWLARPELASSFASVRYALSGSAPLPSELVTQYASRAITLHEGYGLTEAAPGVTLNTTGKGGSIGRPLPGVEVELRDQDGEPVEEEDDPGQLFVRGPNMFSGYWPDGSDGPDGDGWFGTGDIAVRDDDGDLQLVGRSSELVLVNGFNVYPAEVEAVLGAYPGVGEVAVVGVEDADTGEAVVAYVVAAADTQIDVDDLRSVAARSLARFKLPRRVEVVDALPHTATGKVMKWQLGGEPSDAAR
jgi:long-chain acyl-CoA synthetase